MAAVWFAYGVVALMCAAMICDNWAEVNLGKQTRGWAAFWTVFYAVPAVVVGVAMGWAT